MNASDSRKRWVDPDDAPEWTDREFAEADVMEDDRVIRRGRPPSENPKLSVTIRFGTG